MIEPHTLPQRGASRARFAPHLLRKSRRRTRVVVFGSFYGGFHLLSELLEPPLAQLVDVVGVATDDPTQEFTHPKVRLWKYPHTRAEELLVGLLARANNLPLHDGRVQTSEFLRVLKHRWRPDLCLMATFGQKIPRPVFEVPPLGFYNFHHCDATWPSYPGPDPIAAMIRDGRPEVMITLHTVNDVIDGGHFVARSHPVPLPRDINAAALHRITWPQMGGFIREAVHGLLQPADGVSANR